MTKLVRIVKYWDYPNLMRQTPDNSGKWADIQFTLDPVEKCDYVIVLNHIKEDIVVSCPENNVWAIMQEPYIPGIFDWMVNGHKQFAKVFTHHPPGNHKRYYPSQPALPWHVNRSYDELSAIKQPAKDKLISWTTTNKTVFPGHVRRIKFLEYVKNSALKIDLFGKGIRFIEDKWDSLFRYKYSLAVENDSKRDYWTEKIADCFLAYALPIYYGCVNLEDYFPQGSFVRIDINRPQEAIEIIKDVISGNKWETSHSAIAEARNLVLNKHQFFPYITKLIKENAADSGNRKMIRLSAYNDPLARRMKIRTKSFIKKLIQ